jgi:hypothetical protein
MYADGSGLVMLRHPDGIYVSHTDYAALERVAVALRDALAEIVPAFNTARMIMNSQEARDLAGELVAQGRAALSQAATLEKPKGTK